MKKKIEAEIKVLANDLLQGNNLHNTKEWKEIIQNLYDKLCILEYLESQLDYSKGTPIFQPITAAKHISSQVKEEKEPNYIKPLSIVEEEVETPTTEKPATEVLETSFNSFSKLVNSNNAKDIQFESDEPEQEEKVVAINEIPAPIEETASVIQEESEPIEEPITPIVEVTASIEETATPIVEVTAPIEEITTPIEETVTPIVEENKTLGIEDTKNKEEEKPKVEGLKFIRPESQYPTQTTKLQPEKRESEELDQFASSYQTPVFDRKKTDKTTSTTSLNESSIRKSRSLNDSVNRGLHIGLNDRIAFINNLFSGSTQDFNRVLSQINTMSDFPTVESFLENQIKPDYNNWDGKEEYSERFTAIIEKKFS